MILVIATLFQSLLFILACGLTLSETREQRIGKAVFIALTVVPCAYLWTLLLAPYFG